MAEKKEFHIWSEGFHVMEGRAPAHYHGKSVGTDFKDAVERHARDNQEFNSYYDGSRMTYWGCSLFDNEQDARQSFG